MFSRRCVTRSFVFSFISSFWFFLLATSFLILLTFPLHPASVLVFYHIQEGIHAIYSSCAHTHVHQQSLIQSPSSSNSNAPHRNPSIGPVRTLQAMPVQSDPLANKPKPELQIDFDYEQQQHGVKQMTSAAPLKTPYVDHDRYVTVSVWRICMT